MDTTSLATKTELLNISDKKISFLVKKEKRATITYILGLDEEIIDMKVFKKRVCKHLGTGSREGNLVPNSKIKTIGFNGDLVDSIYEILLEMGVDKNIIKK
jgi:translation initiation factor 1 (eIF-1/SUI1)